MTLSHMTPGHVGGEGHIDQPTHVLGIATLVVAYATLNITTSEGEKEIGFGWDVGRAIPEGAYICGKYVEHVEKRMINATSDR